MSAPEEQGQLTPDAVKRTTAKGSPYDTVVRLSTATGCLGIMVAFAIGSVGLVVLSIAWLVSLLS